MHVSLQGCDYAHIAVGGLSGVSCFSGFGGYNCWILLIQITNVEGGLLQQGECVFQPTYMTTGYPSSSGYPVQGQMQQQYAVPAPVPQSYVNTAKPMYPTSLQPAYTNGVYPAAAYSNRQYTMAAPATAPQMVPQTCNPSLLSEVPNGVPNGGQIYMYHGPMDTQMTYAPAMSHQQQR